MAVVLERDETTKLYVFQIFIFVKLVPRLSLSLALSLASFLHLINTNSFETRCVCIFFFHFFLLFLFWLLFWVKDIKIEHSAENKRKKTGRFMNVQEIHRYFTYSICIVRVYNLMCLHNFISFYQVCTQIKEFKVREFGKRIETVHTQTHARGNKWYTAYGVQEKERL